MRFQSSRVQTDVRRVGTLNDDDLCGRLWTSELWTEVKFKWQCIVFLDNRLVLLYDAIDAFGYLCSAAWWSLKDSEGEQRGNGCCQCYTMLHCVRCLGYRMRRQSGFEIWVYCGSWFENWGYRSSWLDIVGPKNSAGEAHNTQLRLSSPEFLCNHMQLFLFMKNRHSSHSRNVLI